MSVVNKKWHKWQRIAGIGLVCSLAVAGCNRSDNAEDQDNLETADATTAQPTVDNSEVAPAIRCDNPMVQDRLKSALESTLERQAQVFAANYANNAGFDLDDDIVEDKVDNILIDVQNAAVLQETNSNGMTTCQASVSMTLASEDLYQASQVHSANNKPSLQSRLAQNNIRINNNMLIDDAFTYIVGVQEGQVRVRIAGQPALINIVSDIMAGSAFGSVMEEQRAERQAQQAEARRRQAAQIAQENEARRQAQMVTPVEPIEPIRPATPPTINNEGSQAATPPAPDTRANAKTPVAPKTTPKDDSIDMVIVEDESATY